MKYLLLISMIAISNASWAVCSAQRCENVEVDRIYIKKDGEVFVGTSGDEKLLNCTAVSGVYATFSLADPGGQAHYSLLLAAQMVGKEVGVRILEGSSKCTIEYVTIDKQ
ncbi:hypothetical protein [Marinagarivorans algicola]|uniref:hypothetical protein n=1 Tax=Marinagarivorans algicola TaxID=1513270 RepID=UPI003734DC48